MFVQITSRLFISQNVLIDPLMTDLNVVVFQQPARDLFRAPIQTKSIFNQRPGFRWDLRLTLPAPAQRQAMRLLRSVAPPACLDYGAAPG